MTAIKITIIGDGMVGKTSIFSAFLNHTFDENVQPTIFDNYEHTIDIFGNHYDLMLFDTAGQEDYARIRSLSYPNTDVFLLCYAINDRNSFDNIKTIWMKDVQEYSAPIILVGTKMDLRVPNSTMYITQIQGLTMGKSIGAQTVIECSAKELINIDKIFEEAVRAKIQESQKAEESIIESGETCKCQCNNCELM